MRIMLALLLCLLAVQANAATVVESSRRPSIDAGGTITAGNTFQSVMAADSNRSSCIIQNKSTHTLYVYLGPTASATTAKSIEVAASGGLFYCTIGNVTVTDNIAVTTTTTSDVFAAFYQD